MLKSVSTVYTVGLDDFVQEHQTGGIDFIKIDIQGAELDVFSGGVSALTEVLTIVSEAEFVPLYIDQPLFGDVNKFLVDQGFMFHKLLGVGGRSIKPFVVNNNINTPVQHMWSDAIFMRDINSLPTLSSEKLLKMAVLSFLYSSIDVTMHCFSLFDQRHKTNIIQKLFEKQEEVSRI